MKHSFNIAEAHKVHQNKYDYSKVVYCGADVKVEIGCPIHGSFWQKGYLHILHSNGCPKCKGDRISKTQRFAFEEYVKVSSLLHNDRYSYIKSPNYKNIFSKVDIVCKSHGVFKQTFNNHIHNKNGCPQCGYNVSILERAWLDSLDIPHLEVQKVLFVGKRKFKVDGYDALTNTIYEFFGVFWHGHPDHATGINPKTKKLFSYHYEKTLDKVKCLRDAGFTVVEKWG